MNSANSGTSKQNLSNVEKSDNTNSLDIQIAALENELKDAQLDALENYVNYPDFVTNLIKISDLYLCTRQFNKVYQNLEIMINLSKFNETIRPRRNILNNIAIFILNVWKSERFDDLLSGRMRINLSTHRKNLLTSCLELTEGIVTAAASSEISAPSIDELKFRLAFVNESLGQQTANLSNLSELIAGQTIAVDLSFVIFKAAVVLKHIGNNEQAMEYLEFLADEPPVNDGYSKIHVLAILALIYEDLGYRYSISLSELYKQLLPHFLHCRIVHAK